MAVTSVKGCFDVDESMLFNAFTIRGRERRGLLINSR